MVTDGEGSFVEGQFDVDVIVDVEAFVFVVIAVVIVIDITIEVDFGVLHAIASGEFILSPVAVLSHLEGGVGGIAVTEVIAGIGAAAGVLKSIHDNGSLTTVALLDDEFGFALIGVGRFISPGVGVFFFATGIAAGAASALAVIAAGCAGRVGGVLMVVTLLWGVWSVGWVPVQSHLGAILSDGRRYQ